MFNNRFNNPFSSFGDDDMFGILGPYHPIVLARKNQELLERPLIIEEITIDKKIKKPIKEKNLKFYKCKVVGRQYKGEILDRNLKQHKVETDCFRFVDDGCGFEATYQIDEGIGNIITIQQKKPSLTGLKKNLNSLEKVFFEHHDAQIVMARGNKPRDDWGAWGNDKRDKDVYYNDDLVTTRLAKFWCLNIRGMIPLRLLERDADYDKLIWINGRGLEKLDKDLKEKLNNQMPRNQKWHFQL